MTTENLILTAIADAIKGTEWEGQVFVAGGFVRDMLLDNPSKDIDLVVTREDGGIRFANWITNRFACWTPGNPVTFPRFGTAKFNLRTTVGGVDISGVDIEAVMPRSEQYTEGSRKPDVAFTSLLEDAQRRDFTVNALFLDLTTGEIVDFVGGQDDIKWGNIRTAIDPNIIFVDDPLRMLRAVRFAFKYIGWTLDPVLVESIKQNAWRIHTISQERIADELSKILLSEYPLDAFVLMREVGLLSHVLPEIDILSGVTQNEYHQHDVFEHTLCVVNRSPRDLVTRLMALFHDCGKHVTRTVDDTGVHFYRHEEEGVAIAEWALRRLKFPVSVIESVKKGVREHMRLKSAGVDGEKISDKALRKLRIDLGDDLNRILDLMHADNISHAPGHNLPYQIGGIRGRLSNLGDTAPAKVKLPVNGNDVMQILGIAPGPRVKEVLKAVEEEWLENPALTREEAIDTIRSYITIARSNWTFNE